MVESPPAAPASRPRDALPGEVVDVLRLAYDVGEWLEWKRTPKGHANLSFFVTTSSGMYVLRCTRELSRKSLESLTSEVALLEYLCRRGYPAPRLVRGRDGQGYVERAGTFYVLTAFIAGGPYDQNNPRHLLAAGRGLGEYHRLMREWSGSYYSPPLPCHARLGPERVEELADGVERLAGRFLDADELAALRTTLTYLRGEFAEVHRELARAEAGQVRLVIQGSYGRSALIFDGDELAGVVDYDRAAYEVRGLDLAYSLKSFCRDDKCSQNWVCLDLALCRDFLSAYREAEPLSGDEARTLPLFFRAQHLLKVLNKCERLLTKNELVPQQAKDIRKAGEILGREAGRLRWLREHDRELAEALAG